MPTTDLATDLHKQADAATHGGAGSAMEARLTDEFNQDKISSNDTKI